MKVLALATAILAAIAWLCGCASDGSFDPVTARQWLDTGTQIVNTYDRIQHPVPQPQPQPVYLYQ